MLDELDVPEYPKNVIWKPMKGSQEAFLASKPIFEVLFSGTRGGGKTDCLLMSYCMEVGKGHGASWKGILFRQTYKQLTDVITKTKKWIPQIWPQARFNHSDSKWVWPTGEELLLRQFDKVDDYWNYHGHEYPWIGWEELCNWPTDEGYKRMFSCCRSSMKGMPRMVRATTNPYGPGHNWVKLRWGLPKRFFQVQKNLVDEEGRPEPPRLAINSHIRENIALLEADPEYINRIAASARNQAEKKAWLEGSWDIVAGGMFDDVWNPEYNVVRPFHIPSTWKIDRSFDWGSSKPFSVGWWAQSDGSDIVFPDGRYRSTIRGDLFRIQEWYGWTGKPNEGLRMLATDIAKGIVERELRWGLRKRYDNWCRVKPGVADSAIFAAENGNSIAVDMKVRVRMDDGYSYPGIPWLPADKRPGSRVTGWDQMRRMLKNAWPSDLGPREKPGLFVFDRCEQFLRTVPVLPRDEDDPDDVNTDAEDHVADEVRYRVRHVGNSGGSGNTTGGW